MSNGNYTNSGPTGGYRLSHVDAGAPRYFSDENAGDLLFIAGSNSQRILIGNNSNDASHIMMTSNALFAQTTLFTPNIQQTTGINITALTNGALPEDVTTATTTTLANAQRITSNQAFGIASLTTSNLNNSPLSNVVLGVNVQAPASFQSNLIVWGDIGIGLSNPAYPLHIGTANSGNVSILASGDVQGFSDARFKTDLAPIDDALTKLRGITGYTFRRTDTGSDRRCAGVLAQDVQRVLPEVVDRDAQSGALSVAYGNLSALIIEAVKQMASSQPALATLRVTTTMPDQAFRVPVPPSTAWHGGSSERAWSAVLISAANAASPARCCAALSYDGLSAEGRCELPGEYVLLFL